MYADKMTNAIKTALSETERRRNIQVAYNQKHNITPRSIKKSIQEALQAEEDGWNSKVAEEEDSYMVKGDLKKAITRLEKEMRSAAKKLEFEAAAEIRDKITELKKKELEWGVFT